jgi:hypothetical protein
MLHVVRQIENRFPGAKGRVVPLALAISACALAVGMGMMLLGR